VDGVKECGVGGRAEGTRDMCGEGSVFEVRDRWVDGEGGVGSSGAKIDGKVGVRRHEPEV
jgi:hypothetical protein